ncbi:oligopeptide/dipeptide ABC transporter ATP-binding protein [Sedimentibacter acidaminivorans]|uniref:Oligopeptide/dipeptide ABC transporter ATP-binding protein n=1 Tax=Sedimentibacter acidaminivorans TaxID=913099 RepID=A0ABS4GC46_9FIRM|nr:ABC transporter ATP-binding protein [Sedimentibacter acidaminivorans]MBP1925273.1 oligopeptide/dipeptide ABC transporter ATP-binding protein [Sedimentibacter acidaminivorans]
MSNNIVEAKNLKVYFKIRQGLIKDIFSKKERYVKAVDGIDLGIKKGEIVSLVGESGSGKTTTGRAILNLVHHEGLLKFDDEIYDLKNRKWLSSFRKRAQMIFQDPYQSLNPKYMIIDAVSEPLRMIEKNLSESEIKERTIQALEFAGLKPGEDYLYRYPHELSGGQRQRVAIATVFVVSPNFIVADEPVSMLDASIRADIVNLMYEMKEQKGTSYLFITHDLSLAWLISDRIAIMYLGKIVEIGPSEIISGNCRHPYTQALVSVLANVDVDNKRQKIVLKGETPSPTNIPTGCRFHPRCPIAKDKCTKEEPQLTEIEKNQFVACHYPEVILRFVDEKK